MSELVRLKPLRWWRTSSGGVALELSEAHARQGSHLGPCDADVAELRRIPYIHEQLDRLDPATLADDLREWGAWNAEELADHDANLSRILWVACGGIVEELYSEGGAIDALDATADGRDHVPSPRSGRAALTPR